MGLDAASSHKPEVRRGSIILTQEGPPQGQRPQFLHVVSTLADPLSAQGFKLVLSAHAQSYQHTKCFASVQSCRRCRRCCEHYVCIPAASP